MYLEQMEEIFKGYLPYYLLVILPIFIIVSPANPVAASSEFPAYRMQHYDLHGIPHGSRSASFNLEARSLTGWSTSRHCVITKFQDLTVDSYKTIKTKAGALLAMLPKNINQLTEEERQHFMVLENAMITQDTSIPVYIAKYSDQLENIIKEIVLTSEANDKQKSATDALVNSIAGNGYQIVVSAGTPSVQTDMKVTTISGYLSGYSADGKIPTVAVVAHYDSFGVAPELSYGVDSNGSGVIVLLEMVRLFSHLYSDLKTRGKYNIIFILSGGGKINYQGSKKWLEDQLDSIDGSIIQEASYVMCLDTLATNNTIHMHVSKPPKEGSAPSTFYSHLKNAAQEYPSVTVEGVHKKINLADDILAWEHERYSIRRLPAFTLSSLKSHRDFERSSILDTVDNLNMERLLQNVKIVVEALGRHIYNSSVSDILGSPYEVNKNTIETWIDQLTNQPRSPQLCIDKQNKIVAILKETLHKYLTDVKTSTAVPDKRDPDFQFYKVTSGTVNVYSVKPAIFDLILTIAIVLYLTAVYFFIDFFPKLYNIVCTATGQKTSTKIR